MKGYGQTRVRSGQLAYGGAGQIRENQGRAGQAGQSRAGQGRAGKIKAQSMGKVFYGGKKLNFLKNFFFFQCYKEKDEYCMVIDKRQKRIAWVCYQQGLPRLVLLQDVAEICRAEQ